MFIYVREILKIQGTKGYKFWLNIYIPSKHTTSFWRWFNVVWTSTTLLKGRNNVVCLLGCGLLYDFHILFSVFVTFQSPLSTQKQLQLKMATVKRTVRLLYYSHFKCYLYKLKIKISKAYFLNIIPTYVYLKCCSVPFGFSDAA